MTEERKKLYSCWLFSFFFFFHLLEILSNILHQTKKILQYNYSLWWIECGWPPGAHHAALSLPLLNRRGENTIEKLMGQDKDEEIT